MHILIFPAADPNLELQTSCVFQFYWLKPVINTVQIKHFKCSLKSLIYNHYSLCALYALGHVKAEMYLRQ